MKPKSPIRTVACCLIIICITFYIILHQGISNKRRDTNKHINCTNVKAKLVGYLKPNTTSPTWEELNKTIHYHPHYCFTTKVAIIIPYRNREAHLRTFLRHMHPYLQRQQINYKIFVIEEGRLPLFNKGIVLNIGFLEVKKIYPTDCFIYHDIDQLPENDNNLYQCDDDTPVHLASHTSQYRYKMLYDTLIGGALALRKKFIEKVNGYSNKYYGWGKEDDDMYIRLKSQKFKVTRHSPDVSKYKSLSHERDKSNPKNRNNGQLLAAQKKASSYDVTKDGISTVSYKVKSIRAYELYTHIYAAADTPLAQYERVQSIPCPSTSISKSSSSLDQCAKNCLDLQQCNGMAYNFSEKATAHNCFLKESTKCKENKELEGLLYFRKN